MMTEQVLRSQSDGTAIMSSDAQGPPTPTKEYFTCPVCLGENYIILDPDAGYVPANPAFELASCHHKFCAACLRAYVRSKLMDGQPAIRCCHFKLSLLEEDFHPCNVPMHDGDIYKLLHEYGTQKSERGDWCCSEEEDEEDGLFQFSSQTTCEDRNVSGEKLWEKYQKLKFDHHHGKDVVRRCPKCDEAQLFDEGAMKQYQATFLTEKTNASTLGDGNDTPMNRFERAFGLIRQRQRDASNGGVTSKTTPKEAGDTKRGKTERGDNSIELVQPTQSAALGSEDGGAKAQDGGSSGEPPESKTPEGSPASATERGESPSLAKSTTPTVNCQNCDAEFCYFHSNAHAGKSCVEYHKKSTEQERSNVEFASRVLRAKPCPTCGIAVSKEGGCNQIKCGSCGEHFCWLCGKIVDDGAFPEHFRWWNLRGCANMQLDENNEPMTCTIWMAKLLSVFQIVVLGIPALVLTFVSMILCPCLVPGCGNTNRERVVNTVSFWGSFLSSMLLLPFTCLGMLILSALYCFLATLAFCMKAFKSQKRKWSSRNSVSGTGGSGDAEREADVALGVHPTASRGVNMADPDANASHVTGETGDDIVRALEAIFERMEEGISSSNSS